jgi:hypothetical protein
MLCFPGLLYFAFGSKGGAPETQDGQVAVLNSNRPVDNNSNRNEPGNRNGSLDANNSLSNSNKVVDDNKNATDGGEPLPPGRGDTTDSRVAGTLNYGSSMPTSIYKVFQGTRSIDKIIVTDTGTPDLLNTMDFLKEASRGVSYHYIINKNGRIYQLVAENNIAIHTAKHNETSVAIGLIHMPDEEYSETQRASLVHLLVDIASRRNIPLHAIFTKQQITNNQRKTDITASLEDVREQVKREIATLSRAQGK